MIHRGYISTKRNYLMGGATRSACTRCGEIKANLFHCFWRCPSIYQFWHSLFCHHSFPFTPSHHEADTDIPSQVIRLLFCKIILQTWIGPTLPSLHLFPSFFEWIGLMPAYIKSPGSNNYFNPGPLY